MNTLLIYGVSSSPGRDKGLGEKGNWGAPRCRRQYNNQSWLYNINATVYIASLFGSLPAALSLSRSVCGHPHASHNSIKHCPEPEEEEEEAAEEGRA